MFAELTRYLEAAGARDMAARLLGKAGFRSAAVGLRKVRPVVPGLAHLYRFLWQWGGQGTYKECRVH